MNAPRPLGAVLVVLGIAAGPFATAAPAGPHAAAPAAPNPVAPPGEERPRWAVGASFGLAQVAGGSGAHDEALSLGAAAFLRLARQLAVGLRYQRAAVNRRYEELRFDSAYHRLAIFPEARLPLGTRFDFAAFAGPEVILLRALVADRDTRDRRARGYVGAAAGAGAMYRWTRLELRGDFVFSWRDRRTDRVVAGTLLYVWR